MHDQLKPRRVTQTTQPRGVPCISEMQVPYVTVVSNRECVDSETTLDTRFTVSTSGDSDLTQERFTEATALRESEKDGGIWHVEGEKRGCFAGSVVTCGDLHETGAGRVIGARLGNHDLTNYRIIL